MSLEIQTKRLTENPDAHIKNNQQKEPTNLTSTRESARAPGAEEAVKIFEEVFDRQPTIFQREQFEVITDASVWRKTLCDWRLNGYSLRNVAGILESYRANLLKEAKADSRNSKQSGNVYVGLSAPNVTPISTRQQVEKPIAFQPTDSEPDPTAWAEVIAAIEGKVPAEKFETWFVPSRGVRCDGGTLIVRVPDKVFEDWIVNNYWELLEEVLPDSITDIRFVWSDYKAEQQREKVAA